jgi:hypothetical protein
MSPSFNRWVLTRFARARAARCTWGPIGAAPVPQTDPDPVDVWMLDHELALARRLTSEEIHEICATAWAEPAVRANYANGLAMEAIPLEHSLGFDRDFHEPLRRLHELPEYGARAFAQAPRTRGALLAFATRLLALCERLGMDEPDRRGRCADLVALLWPMPTLPQHEEEFSAGFAEFLQAPRG